MGHRPERLPRLIARQRQPLAFGQSTCLLRFSVLALRDRHPMRRVRQHLQISMDLTRFAEQCLDHRKPDGPLLPTTLVCIAHQLNQLGCHQKLCLPLGNHGAQKLRVAKPGFGKITLFHEHQGQVELGRDRTAP